MTMQIKNEFCIECKNPASTEEFRFFLGNHGLKLELLGEVNFFTEINRERPLCIECQDNIRAMIVIPVVDDNSRIFVIDARNISLLYNLSISDSCTLTYDVYASLEGMEDFEFKDVVKLIECHRYRHHE